ncbi:hypothetical protein Q9L58_001155 [Maublancomyces gigas]|uniref:Cytochrome c oxidase subunit VIIc n=1 Tax=Discina gigas TaxID=1032678 RepID=A0ABR3GV97_9PEZI
MPSILNRVNRVTQYQRHYQKNDGLRLWLKGPKSKLLLTPYFFCLGVGFSGSVYGMFRLLAGKKSFF